MESLLSTLIVLVNKIPYVNLPVLHPFMLLAKICKASGQLVGLRYQENLFLDLFTNSTATLTSLLLVDKFW